VAVLNRPLDTGTLNAQGRPEDRRASRRRTLREMPHIAGVKVSAESVDVIDASSGGLLVEGSFPVRPGMSAYVDITEVTGASIRVSGSVVRCHIASLAPGKPRYRFAIAFDRQVPMIDAVPLPDDAEATDPLAPFDEGEFSFDTALALNNW
jgi:hypothetical protein